MTRTAQKAALTRAKKSGDPRKVEDACRRAVQQWERDGFWPDDWSTWQIALNDACGFGARLEDLR